VEWFTAYRDGDNMRGRVAGQIERFRLDAARAAAVMPEEDPWQALLTSSEG